MIRIGTRSSPMARAQTNMIMTALRDKDRTLEIEMATRETAGDRDRISRLGRHGGKGGAFVDELREQMRAGEVDMVMHSLKDLPGNEDYYATAQEFDLGAFMAREDPCDALVVAPGKNVEDVLTNGIVGTNAVRRKAYLRQLYRNVTVVHYRGSANVRIEKLDRQGTQELPYGGEVGPVDGLVLARSGLQRIGLADRIVKVFSIDEMCPAVGQGVVVVEYLRKNTEIGQLLRKINDRETENCCLAERAMLRELNGHCNSPIAGYARIEARRLVLRGVVIAPNGRHLIEVEQSTDVMSAQELGVKVGRELKRQGAGYLIEESRYSE